MGSTEELLEYYDFLKPLLSDKIVTRLDKEIKEREKAEEEAAVKEKAAEEKNTQAETADADNEDECHDGDTVFQTENRKSAGTLTDESKKSEDQTENRDQSETAGKREKRR